MSKEAVGSLTQSSGRFEFTLPELNLMVRGPYAEWVLEAAAEIIHQSEKLKSEGRVEELEMLKEFGEDGAEIELDSAKYENLARFEAVPQCLVSMGDTDYRWVSKDGRKEGENAYVQRVHDMSLTRHDTFLADQS